MKSDYDSKEKVHKRAEEILGIPFGELAKDVNSKKRPRTVLEISLSHGSVKPEIPLANLI